MNMSESRKTKRDGSASLESIVRNQRADKKSLDLVHNSLRDVQATQLELLESFNAIRREPGRQGNSNKSSQSPLIFNFFSIRVHGRIG